MNKVSEVWSSLAAMLQHNAAQFGARPAILGPGGLPLSHGELYGQVAKTVQTLRALGVGPADRVAMSLPAGSDLAVAFLAVASGAVAAPLNPAYAEADFQFYLRDLPAKVLLLPEGVDSPARAAAKALGTAVIDLAASPRGGGRFALAGVAESAASPAPDFPATDATALVLHTSGTTSRPKMVPLTQANLCASARNIADALHLQADDISLAAMPLFHIHGWRVVFQL